MLQVVLGRRARCRFLNNHNLPITFIFYNRFGVASSHYLAALKTFSKPRALFAFFYFSVLERMNSQEIYG